MNRKNDVRQDPEIMALLPALSEEARSTLRTKLKRDGCTEPFAYAEIAGTGPVQLDGHNRRALCQEAGIPFDWKLIPTVTTKAAALAWVKQHAIGRRNLDGDELAQLREQRRERVVQATLDGVSTRTIAQAEGVTEKTVRNDLKASGADPSAPERNGTVKGRDNKNYTRPKPGRAKKVKPEGFDLKGWEADFGRVVRGVDDQIRLAKKVQPDLAKKLTETLADLEYVQKLVRATAKATKGAKA